MADDAARAYLARRGITDTALVGRLRVQVSQGRCWFGSVDADGQPTWWTGRDLRDRQPRWKHRTGERPPLFVPLRDCWQPTHTIVLVEGVIDALAALQAGSLAVATLGSSLHEEAVPLLARWSFVILVPDNDGGGSRWLEDCVGKLCGVTTLRMATVPAPFKDLAEVAASCA